MTPAEIYILEKFDGNDEWCYPYRYFEGGPYDRKQLKEAMTSLRKRGFVKYERGLLDEEGIAAGSGFCLSGTWQEREAAIEAALVEQGWQPFTDDYRKVFYSVRLHGGKVIKNCWPNAGKMHAEGVRYYPDDDIMVREQPDFIEEDES